jgi:hypothetical protein
VGSKILYSLLEVKAKSKFTVQEFEFQRLKVAIHVISEPLFRDSYRVKASLPETVFSIRSQPAMSIQISFAIYCGSDTSAWVGCGG